MTISICPSVRTLAAFVRVTATAQPADPQRLSTPTGSAARQWRATRTSSGRSVTSSCVPLISVWMPSMTVRVRSARFHTGSSPSEFDAARIPTAATANPPPATTPISAAGSAALENTLRSRVGAASHMTPAMQIATATQPSGSSGSLERDGRHDGDEDHLGLGVHGADREVTEVEGPQQCDRAEDLGAAGAERGSARSARAATAASAPNTPNVTRLTISASGKP